MIVAPSAADGQSHDAAKDDINSIVNDVVFVQVKTTAEGQVPHCRAVRFLFHPIGGQLTSKEMVIGHVGVQRPHQPIAILVRVSVNRIRRKDIAFGIRKTGLSPNDVSRDLSAVQHKTPSPELASVSRCSGGGLSRPSATAGPSAPTEST